jgi:hypothetical protein
VKILLKKSVLHNYLDMDKNELLLTNVGIELTDDEYMAILQNFQGDEEQTVLGVTFSFD